MRNRVLATTAIAAAFAGSSFVADATFAGSTTATGTTTTGGGTTASGSATAGSGGASATVSTGAATQQKPNEMRARRIMGSDVYNPGNENIGEIEDLVFDEKGQITSAIISVGGFLGIGEKWVAVPWNSVQWQTDDRNNRRASVNMTKDQAKNAPAFQTEEQIRREREADRARTDARATGGAGTPGAARAPTTGTTGGAATGTTGATGTTPPRQ